MQKKKIRIIILVLIIFWMINVFCLSNQKGDESEGLSIKFTQYFFPENLVPIVEPIMRKVAHVTEYAIGGVLFSSLFLTYDYSNKKRMIFSLIVGIEYAAIDEIHQLFIEDRAGSIKDVGIDTIGLALGICFVMLIYKIIHKKRKKAHSDK